MNFNVKKHVDEIKTIEEECSYLEAGKWPCMWISCGNAGTPPFVTAYRKEFSVDCDVSVKVHISADDRYDLFLDGVKIGRGSEYGDQNNWFYETYNLNLAKGRHMLAARTWSLGDMKPDAQVSVHPGFILYPEGEEYIALFGTGVAQWETKRIEGVSFFIESGMGSTGPSLIIDGNELPWGYESGTGTGWINATPGYWGIEADKSYHINGNTHYLRPASLPPMKMERMEAGKAVFVEKIEDPQDLLKEIQMKNNIQEECIIWQRLLHGESFEIPPHTARRVLIDLEGYYCVYPELIVSGGNGSRIGISWAESLYDDPEHRVKSCRNNLDGKNMRGADDIFKPDGGCLRRFDTLWWRCGRFIQLEIYTVEEGIRLKSLNLTETRYPMEAESTFWCNDVRLNEIIPILFRALQMCSHETYMDCPYYEQLMYTGDTRLQMLVTFSWLLDSRLPRKAIGMFHESSLNHMHLANCAYPSHNQKVIPSFCLHWIQMIHDYALWRDDYDFIVSMMPKARETMEKFIVDRRRDGLVKTPKGWNFYDWANNSNNKRYRDNENWSYGEPREGGRGVNSIFNLHIVLVLRNLSELENYVGEPELSTRWKRLSAEIYSSVVEEFWSEEKGMFADDLGHCYYSEHAQALALLSGCADSDKEAGATNTLLHNSGIAKASIYFSHYIFEALVKTGNMDAVFQRLEPWFGLQEMGYHTTPEVFSSITRSDCHAWGSHPLYHYIVSILGIRPGSFGFDTVEIRPLLGPLQEARGTLTHWKGSISAEYSTKGNKIDARISLPPGLYGTLYYNDKAIELTPGSNDYELY